MKKKRLIIAVVIICCVILYIWQTNKIHNTPKKDTAVSTESNATTQQAETTMESDTEEYFEEDTEEEAQLKKTIAELMKDIPSIFQIIKKHDSRRRESSTMLYTIFKRYAEKQL